MGRQGRRGGRALPHAGRDCGGPAKALLRKSSHSREDLFARAAPPSIPRTTTWCEERCSRAQGLVRLRSVCFECSSFAATRWRRDQRQASGSAKSHGAAYWSDRRDASDSQTTWSGSGTSHRCCSPPCLDRCAAAPRRVRWAAAAAVPGPGARRGLRVSACSRSPMHGPPRVRAHVRLPTPATTPAHSWCPPWSAQSHSSTAHAAGAPPQSRSHLS